jgi:hypothetical protein
MPSTTKILTFDGQHLMTTSFNSLSPSHVYRSSAHNCPVFDALTADPANGRLFLFQSTLLDPFKHPVSIAAFNKILLNLALTPSLSGFEIYFIMIASAHSNILSQHFYTFQLSSLYFHSCFLSRYSSRNGLKVLNKFIKGGNVHDKFSSELLSSDEVLNLTSFEKSLLMTIGGLFMIDDFGVERFFKVTLDKNSHDELLTFLKFSPMLKCFLCRAEFSACNVYSVKGKSLVENKKKKSEHKELSIEGKGEPGGDCW